MAYFVQASYGNNFKDYYVKAERIESAMKTAARLFAREIGIATRFIKTAC